LKLATSCDTYQEQISEPPTGERETLSVDVSKGSPSMDYEQHLETYRSFVHFAKYAIVFLAILLLGMKVFLV
jgi:hypothetical protein